MIAGDLPFKKSVSRELQTTDGWTTEAIRPSRYYRVTSGFLVFLKKYCF
jgi:hypothetical protein